jgi:hypothetical protein
MLGVNLLYNLCSITEKTAEQKVRQIEVGASQGGSSGNRFRLTGKEELTIFHSAT